ncbi:MAG: ComF family protein [Pirellulaceae bacterium]|nr:ComF family protein [Pirellulaceae bacterium]
MNAGIEPCSLCKKETFAFDRVIACWTYEGRVCDAIVAAKYAQQSPLGKALGRRLGMRVATATASDPPDQITYVPSNFRRQLSRGGRNGNVAIAHAVSDSLANAGLKVPVRALLRTTRGIKKQAWLNEQQRRENVRGAFAAKKSYACLRTSRLAKSHILLVDDVLTTGATSNEIARVLRQAGAHQVTLAVVARAVWSK